MVSLHTLLLTLLNEHPDLCFSRFTPESCNIYARSAGRILHLAQSGDAIVFRDSRDPLPGVRRTLSQREALSWIRTSLAAAPTLRFNLDLVERSPAP